MYMPMIGRSPPHLPLVNYKSKARPSATLLSRRRHTHPGCTPPSRGHALWFRVFWDRVARANSRAPMCMRRRQRRQQQHNGGQWVRTCVPGCGSGACRKHCTESAAPGSVDLSLRARNTSKETPKEDHDDGVFSMVGSSTDRRPGGRHVWWR